MTILGIILLSLLSIVVVGGLVLLGAGVHLFRTFFPNKSLNQVIKEGEYQEQHVPKSISSMTKVYMPRITKDFPEFNWEEWKTNVENVIKSMLLAITEHNTSLLNEFAGYNIKQFVELSIKDDTSEGVRKVYTDIQIHDTQVQRYTKLNGLCTIKMESSVSYFTWRIRDNEIVAGSKDKRVQTKYTSTLTYIQDYEKVMHHYHDNGFGLLCPNCGAPIKNLGQKFCDYCGTGVVEISTKVWRVTDVEEYKVKKY